MEDLWPKEIPEPDDALLAFLEKLPLTIKGSVFAGGLSCALRLLGYEAFEVMMNLENLVPLLRKTLKEGYAEQRACKCAMIIGVVEFSLEHPEGDKEFYEKLWKKYGDTLFRDTALRAPLRDRHFAGANEEFRSLRETDLSARFLQLWQDCLRAKDHDELEG